MGCALLFLKVRDIANILHGIWEVSKYSKNSQKKPLLFVILLIYNKYAHQISRKGSYDKTT